MSAFTEKVRAELAAADQAARSLRFEPAPNGWRRASLTERRASRELCRRRHAARAVGSRDVSHEKSHLSRAVDLEAHMAAKAKWDAVKRQSEMLRMMTSTWGMTAQTPRERNVSDYVAGTIDHDEYERREESRLRSSPSGSSL